MSLKYKLTLLFAATLTILMVITAVATRRVARLTVEADIQERVNVAAIDTRDALLREVHRRGFLNDSNAAAVIMQSLSFHPGLAGIDLTYWVGTTPHSFSMTATPYGADYRKHDPATEAWEDTPGTLREELWFRLDGGFLARLGVAASLTEADQLAGRLSRVFLLVTGSALLALLGIIYALSHRLVSAPLQELGKLTRRVEQGDLEAHPAGGLSKRRDEVGVLATAFQDMVSALRKARDENQALLLKTQGFNRELEARVKEATRALDEKNRALTEAREELARRQRLAALGQLAGSIAHELGTPLSTLSGYLQLVLADADLPETHRDPLEVAVGEAKRMTRIIRRFLDSTRGLRPAPERLSLPALIDNVLELTLASGRRERFPVRLELSPDAGTLETDPGLLRQVLINLVNNALDAMSDGGTLTFRAVPDGATVVLEVEDEGPGVPLEDRERIFAPFYTTKKSGRGTGLGLSVSREIVRALKGTLTVDDATSGQGARFVIRLPQALT